MNPPRAVHDDDRERRPVRLPDRRRDHAGETWEPPRRRREELPTVLYWLRQLKEWGWLISVVAFVWFAIGFKTSGPGERLAAVEAKVDRLEQRRQNDSVLITRLVTQAVDSLTRMFAPTMKRTDALARYRCLYLEPATAFMLDLDCTTLIPGYPRGKPPAQPDPTEPRSPVGVRP